MSTYRFTRANVDDTVNRVYDYIVEYIRREGYPRRFVTSVAVLAFVQLQPFMAI